VAKKAKPDFGKAGTLTIRKNVTGATINATAGEFIHCELQVTGVQALFSFACIHRPIKSPQDFPGGSPFQWDYLKKATDIDTPGDSYSLVLSFLQATQYTFVMQHRDAAGAVMKVLKDIDYKSTSSDDVFRDAVLLFTV
jgi:hypothetical protein